MALPPDPSQALWASVVLQARTDIEDLPIGSRDYEAAVAFFTSDTAYWRRGREEIAAHLGTDGAKLKHLGTRWVIARRRSEGLPDSAPAPRPHRPRPRPVVVKAPLCIPPDLRRALSQHRHTRPAAENPFSPHRIRA